VDETKIMHVLGEIRNDSDIAMKDVVIRASFYDKAGNLLNEYQRSSEVRVINPGESSAFEVLYIDQGTVDSVANFTLLATGKTAEEAKEKQLRIVSSNSRLDVLGTYYINVQTRNEGQKDATNAIMIATLYDRNGRVIAIGKALAEAVRGSFDIPAGSAAAFGIAITEKLQTYKAARYSLVADSDQYLSETVVLEAMGPGLSASSNNNQTQSGCLIATAAFGSELAPQVQQLRAFRDGIALRTFAGSSFMNVFNAWYYSFSPSVAEYERQSSWLQSAVRASIYPLLRMLGTSTFVYDLLGFNSEMAIVAVGATVGSLVGSLYFAPVAAVLAVINRKKKWDMSMAKLVLLCAWIASVAAIAAAELAVAPEVMMFGTSLLVLSAISTAILAIARAAVRL
jgi:peptide/nickel transport system substrate-binding protein